MSDWERDDDRNLWRASQYANIYGREYAQNYLAWSRALPGIAILIAACFLFPAILLVPLGILLLWGGVAGFGYIREVRRAESERQAREAAIERHQAAVDRLVHDLSVALKDGNDAAVGEVCKLIAREDAFGYAMPHLRLALGDIDPCWRLCAIRGLRWGTRFLDENRTPDGGIQIVVENMPSLLLWNLLADGKETTHLRVAAAVALGNGGYMDAFGSLTRILSDATPEVRAASCHALGRHMALLRGDAHLRSVWVGQITEEARREGLSAVLGVLRDSHPRVRQEAAQALGEFRDPLALRPLQELAADRSQTDTVRRAASDAVAAIRQGVER